MRLGTTAIGCGLLVTILGGAPAAAQQAFSEEALARGVNYPVTLASSFNASFGAGVAFVDLDGDGDPDLCAVGRGDGSLGVFENDGHGHFVDRTDDVGFGPGREGYQAVSGICAGDYDADGDPDLYLSYYFYPNVLLRNDGAYRFEDVSVAAGVDDAGPGEGCSFGDFDGDGWLDLYASNRTLSADGEFPNKLYRNQGDGTFVDVAASLGVSGGHDPSFQGIFLDYDGDADQDIYLVTDKGYGPTVSNRLYRNDGGTFADVTFSTGTAADVNAMGCAVGDLTGNGLIDFYITNTEQGNVLLTQGSPGSFQDTTISSGMLVQQLGWGTLFFDFDNDGDLDTYICNQYAPNMLFVRGESFPSVDLAFPLGVATLTQSFGCATADIDLDGDLDLCVSSWSDLLRIYVNHEGKAREWIRFRVEGRGNNRLAVGAGVRVTAAGVARSEEVRAGGNYKCQNELALHFGLDAATEADEVRVTWPGGTQRTLHGYPGRAVWTLVPPERLGDVDGDGCVGLVDLRQFARCRAGQFGPGCEVMDLDGDADVDDDDQALILRRASGCAGSGDLQHGPLHHHGDQPLPPPPPSSP